MKTPNQYQTRLSGQDLLVNNILKGYEIFNRNSSFIAYIATNAAKNKLFIQFNNGDCVILSDVPKEVIAQAVAAPSIGKFYHASLKGYEAEKVESHCIIIDEDADDDSNDDDNQFAMPAGDVEDVW